MIRMIKPPELESGSGRDIWDTITAAAGDGVQAHTHFEEAEALVQKTRLTAVLLPTAFWNGGAACQPWSVSGKGAK